MTKLEIERAAQTGSMMEMSPATTPVGLFLTLTGTTRGVEATFTEAIRRAEEDAAIDAETSWRRRKRRTPWTLSGKRDRTEHRKERKTHGYIRRHSRTSGDG